MTSSVMLPAAMRSFALARIAPTELFGTGNHQSRDTGALGDLGGALLRRMASSASQTGW